MSAWGNRNVVSVTMSRDAARQAMKDRILETTDRLFYGQGIRAVGVDTIAAEIGISKRTLYNYFPSKDALIVAYLTRRAVPRSVSDRPPLEQILGVFDWLERWFASKAFRGCPFVNAVAEIGERAHPATRIAIDQKERRRVAFRDILTRLGVADPDGLATQLAILVEGAMARRWCVTTRPWQGSEVGRPGAADRGGRAGRRRKQDGSGNTGPAASSQISASQRECWPRRTRRR